MPKAPVHELRLFVAPRSEACALAQAQAQAAAATLKLPFSVIDASLPEHGRLVLGFNITDLPTLVVLHHGKLARSFAEPKDFKSAVLVERVTKHLAKEAARA